MQFTSEMFYFYATVLIKYYIIQDLECSHQAVVSSGTAEIIPVPFNNGVLITDRSYGIPSDRQQGVHPLHVWVPNVLESMKWKRTAAKLTHCLMSELHSRNLPM